MNSTKTVKAELLNNLFGTVEAFVFQKENEELKAVGLGGKYCDNDTAHLIISDTQLAHKFWADNLEGFVSDLGKDLKDVCFYDAIEYSENNDFNLTKARKVIYTPFGEVIDIIKNANVLSDFIFGDKPQKKPLVNHIINILSQKDVNCIDLVGLDSDLLAHIESEFEEEPIIFQQEIEAEEINEEVFKGRVLYSEDNKAIVMIDDVICCVESGEQEIFEECTDYNGTGEKYKETKVIGWTW